MSTILVLTAITVAAVSGIPGVLSRRDSAAGQIVASAFMILSAAAGLFGAAIQLTRPVTTGTVFPWPAMGNTVVGVDPLSAFFLVPVFILGGLGSVYGLGYWPAAHGSRNPRRLQFFWGLLVAGMGLLTIAKHQMAFLLGWEVMALAGFFLVATEDHREESRQAAWVYLIATHVGTLVLFGLFAYWKSRTGSFLMEMLPRETIGMNGLNVVFLLILTGFGLKAGIMPFHFWLPAAHANAPSHVSAIMSGVMLKMGIYGILRFVSLLPDPPVAWGALLLTLGMISGLLGVVYAIAQHDLKRLLAYHSIENIGIILMGLGLALLGRTAGRPEWVVLGMAGSLLHVWNHSFFKALLFFSAGSVIRSTGAREMDQLGGLAGKIPWTAALFLTGAVAISGLPPLNGFISELFLYLGLFQTTIAGGTGSAAVIAVPVLAMIGALAVACFVKVYGTVFLGTPRSPVGDDATEAPFTMRLPMIVLAILCGTIGLAPFLVSPILDAAGAAWAGRPLSDVPPLASLVPLGTLSVFAVTLALTILATGVVLSRTKKTGRSAGTWDCGYALPTSRMQYSASSFAQSIVDLFSRVLKPRIHHPEIIGPFPLPSTAESHVDDAVLDRFLVPAARRIEKTIGWFRRFQHGVTQRYLLYMLVAVVVLLASQIPFGEILNRFFYR